MSDAAASDTSLTVTPFSLPSSWINCSRLVNGFFFDWVLVTLAMGFSFSLVTEAIIRSH